MELTHDGITQPIKEWALDYGIPAELIRSRIAKGWTVARAIEQPMQVRRPRTTPAKPRTPRTPCPIADAARTLGLSRNAIRHRIKSGWDRTRALATPNALPRMVTAHGETLSVAEWSRRTGLGHNCILQRLNRGEAPESALARPSQRARTRGADQ